MSRSCHLSGTHGVHHLADGKMRRRTVMLSQASSQTPWRSPLTLTSDMITDSIMRRDMNLPQERRQNRIRLGVFQTRSRRVVSRIKRLTLLSLALVSARVCLCAMLHPKPHSWEGRTYYTSLWRWPEEKIAERIDANLLNVPIQEITDLPKVMFENKVTKLSKKTQGN